MRLIAKPTCTVLVCVLLMTVGCQRKLVDKTLEIGVGEVHSFTVDAPQRAQQVIVEATADEPVSVYLVLEKDHNAAKDAVQSGKAPADSLGKEEKKKEVKFEATVPAKNEYVVLVGGATKKTNVKVKVTGK
jgi:uncharacterized protein YgbK (DUF1537 family)